MADAGSSGRVRADPFWPLRRKTRKIAAFIAHGFDASKNVG
jgi:hypothetical protein